MTPHELAEAIKADIISEINSGMIPRTVSSFSELHDYLDANCLGPTEGLMEAGSDFKSELAVFNEAQGIVNAWLHTQPFMRRTDTCLYRRTL